MIKMGESFKFNDGFLLGVATASTQIEGGEVDSNWVDWYKQGKIKDSSDPRIADEHYERYKIDTKLMSDMHIKIYRFGLEWARIQPQEGVTDEDVIKHYRDEIELVKSYGIKPLLTIHHFSNPMWFENKGAFLKEENLHYYLEYVKIVVKEFGDLVSEYITINEPNIYAYNSYFFKWWPPGHNKLGEAIKVLNNLCYCHIKAYELIHSMRKEKGYTDTMVSFANHVRVFDPINKKNPWHRFCKKYNELCFQKAASIAMNLGKFKFPLKNKWKIKPGEYSDFIGINYYSRSMFGGIGDSFKENSPRNDLDWEIYPEGIIRVSKDLYDILPRPIWITENGTCDTNDQFRSRYLFEHLQKIRESDLPFERYYHWCFLDNFEWIEGTSARFGIVHVDYQTQIRTIKESGKFFTEMIDNNGVTVDMYNRYVKDQTYRIK